MSSLAFDTLKYIQTLEKAGIPRSQAEAQIKANTEMFTELLEHSIASKGDVIRIETNINSLEHAIKDMQLRIGALIVGLGAFLAAIKFFS